jgi:hypothetical protein
MRRRPSPDSGCQGIAERPAAGAAIGEPVAATDVHETVRNLSAKRLVLVSGALAAALAGAAAGAQARPAASLFRQTLGPRMDFDRAAHPSAPAAPTPIRVAAQAVAWRAG